MLAFFTSRFGISVIALTLLVGMGWVLREAWEDEAVAEQEAASLQVALKAEKEQRAKLDASLLVRENKARVLTAQLDDLKIKFKILEANNEELRQWADTKLPMPIIDELRKFSNSSAANEVPTTGSATSVPNPTVPR